VAAKAVHAEDDVEAPALADARDGELVLEAEREHLIAQESRVPAADAHRAAPVERVHEPVLAVAPDLVFAVVVGARVGRANRRDEARRDEEAG
jgi:hypothetical protein